jgi:hypothetical protein
LLMEESSQALEARLAGGLTHSRQLRSGPPRGPSIRASRNQFWRMAAVEVAAKTPRCSLRRHATGPARIGFVIVAAAILLSVIGEA